MLRGHTFIGGFSQGPSKMIGASKRLRISAYLSASFLLIFGLLAVFPVANSISDTNAAARISETTLSMASSDMNIVFDSAPTTKGVFGSASAGISVVTNNASGYTFSVSASSNDIYSSKLSNDEDLNVLESIETALTEAEFSAENATSLNGFWGYKPSKYESLENNYFLPAPTYEGSVIDSTVSANSNANQYTLTLGARVNKDNTIGNYSNKLHLNVVANPVGYSITYNKNAEGTVKQMPETQSGSISETIVKLSNKIPERNGFTFYGWCDGEITTENGVSVCDGDLYHPNDDYGIDQTSIIDITLYAVWREASYVCNSNATTISEAVCMQDINKNVKASMNEGDQYQLIDDRDGKTYWISKLADGKVWMTQNLDLDLEAVPTNVKALTHDNTDLGWGSDIEVMSWVPVNSTLGTNKISSNGSIIGWNSTYSNHSTPYSLDVGDWYWIGNWDNNGVSTWYSSTTNNYLTGNAGDVFKQNELYSGNGEHGHVGNYYNWAAAIAENDISSRSSNTYDNPNRAPQNSICPAGWRLPSITNYTYGQEGTNDYYNLILANGGSTNDDKGFTADPNYFVRAGYVYDTYLSNSGYYGYYWTQNNYDANNAYAFYHYGSYLSYNSNTNMYYGASIRCVARDNGTITFDANGGSGTMAPQEIYGNAIINENTFTKEGKSFGGWNTAADGSGDSYKDKDLYLIENGAEVELFAQWVNYTTLEFNGNGADAGGPIESIVVDYSKTVQLPTNTFSKNGMAFVGWNTADDGSGDSYINNGKFVATDTNGGVVTLYAMWEPVSNWTINYRNDEWLNTVQYSCHKTGPAAPKYSHSSNVNDAGEKLSDYGNNVDERNVVTIEGASGLHIVLTYAGESPSYDWVSLWPGSHPEYSAYNDYSTGVKFEGNTTGKYGGSTGTTVEGDIEGDTVTFAFRSDGGGTGSYGLGYYAVITALDGVVCDDEPLSGEYETPEVSGQVFLGWNDTANSNAVKYKTEKAVWGGIDLEDVSRTKDVYAVMAKPLTINFNANGGEGDMESMVLKYGESDNLSGVLFTKEGETFARWNTEPDGSGTGYTDQQIVSATDIAGGEITLYAMWGKPTIINFNANGGEGTMDQIIINYGEYKTLPLNTFTRSGATYVRWNTAANGSGSSYSDGTYYGATSDLNGAEITMYVVWGFDTVINFNANGGEGTMGSQAIPYGTSATLTPNAFTKENSTFYRWRIGSTNNYYNNEAQISANNINGETINLSAVWGTNSTVIFNANNGTGDSYSQTIPYNVPTALTPNQFTKADEAFAWWSTNANSTVMAYADEGEITIANINGLTINLYAVWGKKTTIVFDGNGADGGTMANQLIDFGATATLNTNAYTYTGKKFRGWNASADGTGVSYTDYTATVLAGDTVTLYAIWSSESFPDDEDIPDAGSSETGITIARAYEIAYTAAGKGMYQETAYGNGIYEEVREELGDEYHGGWDVRFAMQDMTPEICASVTVMEDTYRALDVRDNKLYWITKMKDGNCWMSQSLRLDLETTPTNVKPLTHENTDLGWTNNDITATWTPSVDTTVVLADWDHSSDSYSYRTSPKSYNPGEEYYFTNGYWGDSNRVDSIYYSLQECMSDGHSKSDCTHRQAGYYYNWTAAIAQNSTASYTSRTYQSAPDSICPAGWRLPKSMTSSTGGSEANASEYLKLYYKYGITSSWPNSGSSASTDSTVARELFWSAPFYYYPHGYISKTGRSVDGVTVYNGELDYYGMGYNSFFEAGINGLSSVIGYGSVGNVSGFNAYYGFDVRCIAR